MKFSLKTIAILICLIGALSCGKVNEDCNLHTYANSPDQTFFKSHNGSEEESHGHFILSCSDGGFLQVGETGSLKNSAKILVIKTDQQGELIWKKEFSDGTINLGNSAIEVNDGYIVCGAKGDDSFIAKLQKSTGSILFENTIENGGSDAFEHLIVMNDQIITVGYRNAEDNLNTFFTEGEGFFSFLDLEGNLIQGLSLSSELAHCYRIEQFNGNLFVSGLTENASDYGLLKLDSTGNILWSKRYGGSDSDHCFGMDISSDGSIFLTGHTLSGSENWDTYTVKISNDGDLLWESVNGNPRGFKPKFIHDEAWGIKATTDGGCILVAGTGDEYGRYKRKCGNDGDNSNTWHVYLVKLDNYGDVEWQQTYGQVKSDWAGEDIDLTADGGAIIAVDNGEFGFLKISPF
ncbi:MAG: hypothetical protein MK078_16920 [Crocinitomicaceae bacterium]|nr:hypothetical protein [Crocinitomicaceae bacterium]